MRRGYGATGGDWAEGLYHRPGDDYALAGLETARDILSTLQSLGIRVALDDFGTGYSSLYHLRELNLDLIKIDRSFIESLNNNPESEKLVNGIVGLAMAVAAEEKANGIRVSSIYPGEVDTPILEQRPAPVTDEHRQSILKPEDVAEAVLFVATLPARAAVPEIIMSPTGYSYI